ncbi:MAG TPA: HIRAN domain-containing protein, partial [Bryobacteraceae bacterium]|nr:HIRAN domain-containing protein [Bryobacteraceae bacterium]
MQRLRRRRAKGRRLLRELRRGGRLRAVTGEEQSSFYSKLVGVTHDNDDGVNRQFIIRSCLPGDRLRLVRQPNNPYDNNAVFVTRQNGDGLGYLDRRTCDHPHKRRKAHLSRASPGAPQYNSGCGTVLLI